MRQKLINRFNIDPDQYPFIKQFQEIMIAKLTGDLTNKQIKKLILCKFKRPLSSIKINPKDLLLLTTQVEPEIYLLAQETAKKVTGNYISIEQLLHILLTAFIETYRQEPFKKLPFEHVHKGIRFKNLQKFQAKFSSSYPNYIRSWEDD